MKKFLSICFLWAISLALWGQTNGKYDEGFNPTNPGNPQEPSVTMKYDFKVTAGNGGSVSSGASGAKITAGTNFYLSANAYSGYSFKCWLQDGKVISTSSWFYYTMPANDVEIQAVFAFEPVSPTNPDVLPLTYKVTVESSPSNAGNVYRDREKVNVGEYTYVSASPYNGYRFKGWQLDGEIVSTNTYYNFEMPSRNMHFTALFEFDPAAPSNPNNNPNGGMTYLVRYIIDGQVCYTEYLPEGATITTIAAPNKKGHTFSGWMNLPSLMPAKNLDITGTFSVNNYHLVYKVEDKVIHEEDVPYGSILTPPVGEVREGHTLTWSNLPSAMPDSDITVNGFYSVNKYKLTYILDGKVNDVMDVTYGTPITPKVVDEREGYTFSGWSEVPATMPAKDVIITGSFVANKYTLTYIVDGEAYQSNSVDYGTKLTAIAFPTKEGHTFSGWSELPATMPANDVTVTGSFTVNSYTLTYTVDGKEYDKSTVDYGTKLTAVAAPTKEGHTFSGWSELPATMPAQDVTITGSFTVNSYKITYIVDGAVHATDSIAYGTSLTAIASPAKEGHTFSGWSETPATMPANDVTVTGSFTVNSYTLTYTVDGKEYSKSTVVYGTELTAVAAPTKEGHTFSGWSEIPATMPAQDVTITGSFTVDSYKITYIVDGAVHATDSIAYGTSLTAIASPAKEGHTFSGWSEIPATMPANDVTATGSFTVNTYKITYTVDGAEYATDSIAYGTTLTAIDAPIKEGHTFSGWSEIPEKMPASDLVIDGMFVINKYLVVFKIGDEVIAVDSLEYGATIVAPEAPEKEGYTFDGWGEVAETVPANDVTIEGSYSVNFYLLSYTVDGETVQTDSVAYGTAVTLLDDPTKEGHTFSGWSEAPETMPASDVIISGTFTVNKYLVTFKIGNEVIAADSLEYGATIVAPEAPEREGYTFDGWEEVAETVPASDVTYEGSYTVNTYLLAFMVDGEVIQTDSVAYGTAIALLEEPAKEGYTFSGWSEAPETMPANDITVSGAFTINKYLVTFKIGDEVIASDSLEYGAMIVTPEAPEREGYTFDGWGDVVETVPANDVTIEGSYTANIYKVYYYVGEELVHTAEVTYGEAIPEYIYEPTEEGYTFLGWLGEAYETMPAHDVTYTANIESGINQLLIDNGQLTIYDLAGRKVLNMENLKGGIYIVNGKKVVFK